MKIQSSLSTLLPTAPSKNASQQGISPIKFSLPDPVKVVDSVALSNEGKTRAAEEKNGSNGEKIRTTAQNRLIESASSDPQSAEKLAHDIAYANSVIFYDLTLSLKSNGPIRLAVTKEVVTDEYKENFEKTAPLIDQQRRLLYETEKAKGTDPVEILKMLFDFTNSQSRSYLEATAQVEEAWRA